MVARRRRKSRVAMKGTPAARPGLAVMQKGLQRQREAFPDPVRVRASRPAPGDRTAWCGPATAVQPGTGSSPAAGCSADRSCIHYRCVEG